MDEPAKRTRLADRYANQPIISFLIMNWGFASVLVGLVLVGLIGALSIPRLWTVKLPYGRGGVRVSLVDVVQTWSLKLSARNQAAAGKHSEAARAYDAAIAHNRGNLNNVREALRHTAAHGIPTAQETASRVALGRWLLSSGGTNRADLRLVVSVLDRLVLPSLTLDRLRLVTNALDGTEQRALVKALLLSGQAARFQEQWSRMPATATNDPDMVICQLGYRAGWGSPEEARPALDALKRHTEDPERSAFACRVVFAVCRKTLDVDAYDAALTQLERRGLERVGDHTEFWLLLDRQGAKNEARRLAEDYAVPPASAAEAALISETLLKLDMAEAAGEYLAKYQLYFPLSHGSGGAQLWVLRGRVFEQRAQWDQLRSLAMEMRAAAPRREVMGGYSHYLEGKAFTAQGQAEEAAEAFRLAGRTSSSDPDIALAIGLGLVEQKQPQMALRALEPIAAVMKGRLEYWEALFDIAYAIKEDNSLLLEAAARAYELVPESPRHQINYAAALLINRRSPDLATKFTLLFLNENPNSLVAVVNHSFALAQNLRLEEAENLIQRVNPAALGELELTSYHLCWTEILAGRGNLNIERCRPHLEAIQGKYLFPVQQRWLDQIRVQVGLPAVLKTPAGPDQPRFHRGSTNR